MERSIFEERKKDAKTVKKDKKDIKNLNMKSSDSIERYRRDFEGYNEKDDHSQDIGNTFHFDGNLIYQGSPMLEMNSFTMGGILQNNF